MKMNRFRDARVHIIAQILSSILRHEDLSYPQIARMHDVSDSTVARIAHAHNVHRKRGPKENN